MARVLKILLASLTIGLLLSIAVAWASSLRATPRNWSACNTSLRFGHYFCGYEYRWYPGVQVAELKPMRPLPLAGLGPGSIRQSVGDLLASVSPDQKAPEIPAPSWIGWPGPEDNPLSLWSTAAAGWPAKCLVSHRVGSTPTEFGSLAIKGGAPWPVGRLPLLPHWPGLAIDTAAYGVPAAAGWMLLLTVRQRGRHRRGLCPCCAYDLRADFASGCPECGWNRASASAAASRE